MTKEQQSLLEQEAQKYVDNLPVIGKLTGGEAKVPYDMFIEVAQSILSDPGKWELTPIKQTAKFIKLAADKSFELVEVRQERDKLKEDFESIQAECNGYKAALQTIVKEKNNPIRVARLALGFSFGKQALEGVKG